MQLTISSTTSPIARIWRYGPKVVLFEFYSSGSSSVILPRQVLTYLGRGTRATGVEYVIVGQQAVTRVFARRLVVLSSGAFGTPAILERSGIGSKEVLRQNEVETLVDLPGVGENFNGKYYRHTWDNC